MENYKETKNEASKLDEVRENQKPLEVEFNKLEKDLKRILLLLFKEPIFPVFDWFLKIVENPELAPVFGLPSIEDSGSHIRSLISSDSGFSQGLRAYIAHRLYAVFDVIIWFQYIHFWPNWINSYIKKIRIIHDYIDRKFLPKTLKNDNVKIVNKAWNLDSEDEEEKDEDDIVEEGVDVEVVVEEKEKDEDIRLNLWYLFHSGYSTDIHYLLVNLFLLNNPVAYGEKAGIFNPECEEIFNHFVKKLDKTINVKLGEGFENVNLINDFSKLLWSLDTLLLNKRKSKKQFRDN
ncbi:MAG: hypothetical protein RAP70_00050 [Candidatus Celaenobacter antarcticus]|nr:hypothetical protein [Candidatus Celaenobacter antarcticus]